MASPGRDNYRMKSYKNKALNPQEMRRRREEEGIQLRKQKREEQVGVLRYNKSIHSSLYLMWRFASLIIIAVF